MLHGHLDGFLIIPEHIPDLGDLRLAERNVLRPPRLERRACSSMDLQMQARVNFLRPRGHRGASTGDATRMGVSATDLGDVLKRGVW